MLKTNIVLIQAFKEDVKLKILLKEQSIRPISSFKYNEKVSIFKKPKKSGHKSIKHKCNYSMKPGTIQELSYKYIETLREMI